MINDAGIVKGINGQTYFITLKGLIGTKRGDANLHMLTDITIEHDQKVHHYEVTMRVARPNNNPFTSLETAARAQKKHERLENLRSISSYLLAEW